MAKVKTNWIKYRICGRGGAGWKTMKWLYAPGVVDEDKDSIVEHILHERESWAIHAERFQLDFWKHATPPIEVVEQRMQGAKRNAKFYREEAKALAAQLVSLGKKTKRERRKAV